MTLIVEDGTGIFGEFSSQFTANNGVDTLTITDHGLVTGYGPYLFVEGSGVLPGGIVEDSFYYVVVIDEDTIKLATTLELAEAETPDVVLSSDGTDHATRLMIAANANSYISIAEFQEYHDARGNDYSAASTDTLKEQAIIKAMDYINLRWGSKFKGTIYWAEQHLDFPRRRLYDNNGILVEGIPTKLKNAVAEYALRAISSSLLPDPVTETNGLLVSSTRTKVGPIEEQTTYQNGGLRITKPYPLADMYLKDYVANTDGVMRG